MVDTRIDIYGASGHAKVVAELIRDCGHLIGTVFDDSGNVSMFEGANVSSTFRPSGHPLIIAIGDCRVRQLIAAKTMTRSIVLTHSSAIVSPRAEIGEGSVVMQGAIVQVDAKIGRHCIINTGASIDHECEIADFVHIAPRTVLSGRVIVSSGSWIGVGSCVKQGIKIGRNCLIGAGSVVVSDIPDNMVAFGNPCRIIRPINNQ